MLKLWQFATTAMRGPERGRRSDLSRRLAMTRWSRVVSMDAKAFGSHCASSRSELADGEAFGGKPGRRLLPFRKRCTIAARCGDIVQKSGNLRILEPALYTFVGKRLGVVT